MHDNWHRREDGFGHQRRGPNTPVDGSSADFSLLSVALMHKTRLVIVGLVATILAYAALTQVVPTYELSAQVLLEVQADQIIDIPNGVPEAPDGIATLESAIILMRSPEIMQNVVQELDLTERAEFNPNLRDVSPLDHLSNAISAAIDVVKKLLGVEPEIAGSPRDPVEQAARVLRENVSVRSIGESRVIEVTTQSESARLAAQISNAIASEYIRHQIAVKAEAGDRVTQWLEERTNDSLAQLEADERKLTEFGREMIASEHAASTDLDAQLIELNTQLIQLDKQQLDLEAQLAEIIKLRSEGNYLTLASVVELPTLTALVEQLAALDGSIVELNAIYGDHLKTREALETRRQLITLLETESARLVSGLEVRVEILEDRRSDLAEQIRALRVTLVARNQDNFRLDALTREFETSRNVYERFLLRQKEMRQRSQFQTPGARLVAEAERPSAPVAPQKAKLALLAGIAGGVVQLLYLALRQARRPGEDETGSTEAPDLLELKRMGTLVTLPQVSDMKHPWDILRYVKEQPDSDLGMAISWLKSYLQPQSNNWVSIILVTSADQGEGKSTLSLLLAESLSRDYKTVLINADPSGWLADFAQSDAFDKAGFGLVAYSDDIVRFLDERCALDEHLHDKSKDLLGAEIVVLDAPAMPLAAGLLEIGQQADHTIIASSWDHLRLNRIRRCARALEEMGIVISAIALTMIPRDSNAALMQLPSARSPLQLPKRSKTL